MRYKNRYETTCKNSQAARHPAFSFTTPFFAPVKLQKRSILEMAENTQPQLKRPADYKINLSFLPEELVVLSSNGPSPKSMYCVAFVPSYTELVVGIDPSTCVGRST